jgi:hypothetical protein
MVQQRGVKRSAKVAVRKKKLNFQAKVARARKAIREIELASKEENTKE